MKINIAQNDGLPEDHLICIFIDIIQRNPWKIEDVWSSNWRLKMLGSPVVPDCHA